MTRRAGSRRVRRPLNAELGGERRRSGMLGHFSRRRSWRERQARRKSTAGNYIDRRYLVTVRRATLTPRSASSSVNCTSESGLRRSSAAMNSRNRARIAVAEQDPPLVVASWREKNRLNATTPRGVAMNLWLVARDTVDSCSSELVGDLPQCQRTHGEVAVLEEILLPRDDRLGNALDRQEALLEIAHQPACLLQMLREQRRLAVARLAEIVRVLLVYADARIDRSVDA